MTAVLWANLGGQELGPALVDILYGDVNPSGRLVYTIAKDVADYVQAEVISEPQPHPQLNYTEGVLVDYRRFEALGVEPRFWFGHGLSYSEFSYGEPEVKTAPGLAAAVETPIEYVADAPGGDTKMYDLVVYVMVNITNLGPFDGTEVVQLYVEMPEEAGNIVKILRGFEVVKIRDGETLPVAIQMTRKDISYWSVVKNTWITPRGLFTIKVGASSKDIRAVATFEI